jgi:hypothetical protein
MPEGRTDIEVSRLAESLANAQNLDPDRAERLARRIAEADEDIWQAALLWASTGEMPSGPTVEGRTPARLSIGLSPSQTFTTLMALRSIRNARRARSAIRPTTCRARGRPSVPRMALGTGEHR